MNLEDSTESGIKAQIDAVVPCFVDDSSVAETFPESQNVSKHPDSEQGAVLNIPETSRATGRVRHSHSCLLPRYLQKALKSRGRIRRFLGGRVVNKHQNLFVFEAHGPSAALYAVRFGLLSEVVLSAVALEEFRGRILCTGAGYTPGDGSPDCSSRPTPAGLVVLVTTVIVSLATVLLLGSAMRRLVVATSIECMKRWDDIANVVAAASRKREHATFCTLVGIAAAANKARAAVQSSNDVAHLDMDSTTAYRSNRQEASSTRNRLSSIHLPRLKASSRASEDDPLRTHLRVVFDEIAIERNGIAAMNRAGLITALQV